MTFSMAFFKTYFSLVSVQKSASRVSAATEATRVDKINFFAIFVTLDISRFFPGKYFFRGKSSENPLKYLLACSSGLQFVFSLQVTLYFLLKKIFFKISRKNYLFAYAKL